MVWRGSKNEYSDRHLRYSDTQMVRGSDLQSQILLQFLGTSDLKDVRLLRVLRILDFVNTLCRVTSTFLNTQVLELLHLVIGVTCDIKQVVRE